VALPEPAPPPAAAAPVVEAPAAAPQRLARVDTTTARQAIGSGIYRLQLVAVRSEGGLTQAWADLRQRHPALNAVNPQVERTDTSSGPLFRLQAGPFTSREAAANACGSIRAAGGQCFIVGPIGG
jgi:cell division septation protein DedD